MKCFSVEYPENSDVSGRKGVRETPFSSLRIRMLLFSIFLVELLESAVALH
mgnify:CR=1 FL=1